MIQQGQPIPIFSPGSSGATRSSVRVARLATCRACPACLPGSSWDHHAAEDAAQATFLILARKAHTLGHRFYGGRVALPDCPAGGDSVAKDRTHGAVASTGLDRIPAAQRESTASSDEVETLCTEVDRLPSVIGFRLLCFFEGLTHAEAARRTGWAIGTVADVSPVQRISSPADSPVRELAWRLWFSCCQRELHWQHGSGCCRICCQGSGRSRCRTNRIPSCRRSVESHDRNQTASSRDGGSGVHRHSECVGTDCGAAPQASTTPETPTASPTAAQPPQTPAEEKLRNAAYAAVSINNLKQIVLAIHAYCDVNEHFPQNITDKDGKPLLSWRVAILPYISQDELYKKFKLDEPWDSEHNKKLIAQIPTTYRTGFDTKNDSKTYFQVFAGTGTPFEAGKKIKFTDITDGTANTLAVVEAGPLVEWSKPADIAYDPKKPLPKLQLPFRMLSTPQQLMAGLIPSDQTWKTRSFAH